MQSLCHCRRGP